MYEYDGFSWGGHDPQLMADKEQETRCQHCNQKTKNILVDTVDEQGMVFCGWHCLSSYAANKQQSHIPKRNINYIPLISHKGEVCPYTKYTFCQEGDCDSCELR